MYKAVRKPLSTAGSGVWGLVYKVFGYATFPPLSLDLLLGFFLEIIAGMDVVSEIKEESSPPWAADGCEYTPSVTC